MTMNDKLCWRYWCALLSLALLGGCMPIEEIATTNNEHKEYIVGVNRPNNLFVVDVEARNVIQNCELPGHFGLGTLALSPDNRIAYVLNNGSEDIFGVDLKTCQQVFRTRQSQGDVQVRSMASIAVSRDGKELYTVQLRTQHLPDQLKALEPRLAVFNTADGLDAKPVLSFVVPRQITTLAVGKDGTVYGNGPDFYAINPDTGEFSVALAGRSFERPLYTNPDGITVWNMGDAVNEFFKPYSTIKFADETHSMDTAKIMLGFMRLDLETGETIRTEVGEFQSLLFSAATHPKNHNHFYGVAHQLTKYDAETQQLVKIVDLDHAYYGIGFSPKADKIFLGGTLDDIAIYDPETLEKLGQIKVPGGGDMAMSSFQVFIGPLL